MGEGQVITPINHHNQGEVKLTKNTDNNKNNNVNGAIFAILVGAGLIIAIDTFFGSGGIANRALLGLTILALIIVTLVSIINKSLKDISLNTQSASHSKIMQISRAPIVWVAIIFGIIGISIAYLYSYRNNLGINVQWNYYPKPENSPIEKFTSDGSGIMVKTQSEQYFTTSAWERCYGDYCWFRLSSYENITYEDKLLNELRLDEIKALEERFEEIESTIADPACYAKTLPKYPPEGQISNALIFRECKHGDVHETRIIVAKDGGLWIWYNWSSQSNVITNTFLISIFVAPVLALIGALLFKLLRPNNN